MLHIFIQARVGSKRFPNKVLLPFLENKCILDIIVEKLQVGFPLIPVIVCTTKNKNDDSIQEFCKKKKIECFRGDEINVLKRFIDAGKYYKAKNIVRICADNPFIDIQFLKELFDFCLEKPFVDYWSFKNHENIPVIKTHFGFFAEIVTLDALLKVELATNDPIFLEHVTNFIYGSNLFECELKKLPDFLIKRDDLRFTIDDHFDFETLQKVYEYYLEVDCDLKKTILFVEQNKLLLKSMIRNINKYSK